MGAGQRTGQWTGRGGASAECTPQNGGTDCAARWRSGGAERAGTDEGAEEALPAADCGGARAAATTTAAASAGPGTAGRGGSGDCEEAETRTEQWTGRTGHVHAAVLEGMCARRIRLCVVTLSRLIL